MVQRVLEGVTNVADLRLLIDELSELEFGYRLGYQVLHQRFANRGTPDSSDRAGVASFAARLDAPQSS